MCIFDFEDEAAVLFLDGQHIARKVHLGNQEHIWLWDINLHATGASTGESEQGVSRRISPDIVSTLALSTSNVSKFGIMSRGSVFR